MYKNKKLDKISYLSINGRYSNSVFTNTKYMDYLKYSLANLIIMSLWEINHCEFQG